MRELVALWFLFWPALASLAADVEPARAKVNLYQQCSDDSVGQRLAFKVKEGLNRSTTMSAVDSYGESAVMVSLVCVSPDAKDRGNYSVYSYQVTLRNFEGFYDFALTHGVGTCGTQRVDDCAESIVATVDSAVSGVRAKIRDGSFKWFSEPVE